MATSQETLLDVIREALHQLSSYSAPGDEAPGPLPSLLMQCEDFLANAYAVEPIRTLHHLACTGGTVISKCLATMPNTVLLSEIDPLSRMLENRSRPHFAPTDVILGLRHSLRGVDEAVITEIFNESVAILRDRLALSGQVLVLRDHPHSHFFTEHHADGRPTLRDVLQVRVQVLPLVTVRHPLDSYMSVVRNGWHQHFQPSTIEEYARRSLLFLRRYADVERIKYEDFTHAPAETLRRMCAVLQLDYAPDAPDLLKAVAMSGDSGRRGDIVAPRPPQPIPTELVDACAASDAYEEVCALLEYDPGRGG